MVKLDICLPDYMGIGFSEGYIVKTNIVSEALHPMVVKEIKEYICRLYTGVKLKMKTYMRSRSPYAVFTYDGGNAIGFLIVKVTDTILVGVLDRNALPQGYDFSYESSFYGASVAKDLSKFYRNGSLEG